MKEIKMYIYWLLALASIFSFWPIGLLFGDEYSLYIGLGSFFMLSLPLSIFFFKQLLKLENK